MKNERDLVSSSDVEAAIDEMLRDIFLFAHAGDMTNLSRILDLLGLNVGYDKSGNTLMHVAAIKSNIDLAKLLISVGFSVSIKNQDGLTPYEISCRLNDHKMSNFFQKETSTMSMIDAVVTGNFERFVTSVNQGADIKRIFKFKPFVKANIIHYIAHYNQAEMLQYVCANAAIEIDLPESNMLETILHIAAQNNNCAVIKVAIQYGSNIEKKDIMGWTPLHRAVINESIDALKLLILNGANINTYDIMDNSPAKSAFKNNCKESLSVLLKKKPTIC